MIRVVAAGQRQTHQGRRQDDCKDAGRQSAAGARRVLRDHLWRVRRCHSNLSDLYNAPLLRAVASVEVETDVVTQSQRR